MAFRSPTPILDLALAPRDQHHELGSPSLRCCCGNDQCMLLRRNCSILDSVEKDVHTAAQLGQALLARHESYMANAEQERRNSNARIERLELDKQELESENASIIAENKSLLEQLEALNHMLGDSDAKIKSLESTLLSSNQAIRRLEAAASRAADAERHLALLEEEQDKLHGELRVTKEDARTHAQRFKEAQRDIRDMQEQLERIEEEARQERERHTEALGRMERQREIEKQLDTAAGRLKGAAATKSFHEHKNSNKIVGHFVRDLLQDNANLQLGIAELREMLINSNDEIQALRDQLMDHQPVTRVEESSPASTLRAELEPMLEEQPSLSEELHTHHHFHAKSKQGPRKSKKRRQGLLPGIFTPPTSSAPTSPRSSDHWGITSSPTASALLSRASRGEATSMLSKSNPAWNHGSEPASEFSSSVPSSPQIQQNGVFDSGYPDSDAVTSPTTSYDPMSPTWRASASHSKQHSMSSLASVQSMSMSLVDSAPTTPSAGPTNCSNYPSDTIEEEEEEDEEDEQSLPPLMRTPDLMANDSMMSDDSFVCEDSDCCRDEPIPQPRLQRMSSHESIISLTGGLDIHTLKSRPSQLTLRPLGGADAVVTGVIARPTLLGSSAKRSDAALRDRFAGFQTPPSMSRPTTARVSSAPVQSQASSGASGALGKLVGWRPWGGSSSPSSNADNGPKTAAKDNSTDADREFHRSPGINQSGVIPGFQQYWLSQKRKGAPAQVTAHTVDRTALSEILEE